MPLRQDTISASQDEAFTVYTLRKENDRPAIVMFEADSIGQTMRILGQIYGCDPLSLECPEAIENGIPKGYKAAIIASPAFFVHTPPVEKESLHISSIRTHAQDLSVQVAVFSALTDTICLTIENPFSSGPRSSISYLRRSIPSALMC